MQFFQSIARPFSSAALGACLPYSPDRNSLKVTTLDRFSLTATADGTCYIAIAPCLANDAYYIYYNGASSTMTWPYIYADVEPVPPQGFYQTHNGPFTTSQLRYGALSAVSGRVVSVGIRITYTGTVSNMSGTYFANVPPDHQCVNQAGYNPSNVLAFLETKVSRVTGAPFEMGFAPSTPEEHKYFGINEQHTFGANNTTQAIYPWSSGKDANNKTSGTSGYIQTGAPCILAGVLGATNGAPFYVEVIQHLEFCGKGAAYGLTPSHNDEQGAGMVQAASERATAEYNASGDTSWATTMAKSFNKVMSEHGSRMARGAANAVLRGAMRNVGRPRDQLAQLR